MDKTGSYTYFPDRVQPGTICRHITQIIFDGAPEEKFPGASSYTEPPKRKLFARVAFPEHKNSLRKRLDQLQQDGRSDADLAVIRQALREALHHELDRIIDQLIKGDPNTRITGKDIKYDDRYDLGVRFRNRDFTASERALIKHKFQERLHDKIHPRAQLIWTFDPQRPQPDGNYDMEEPPETYTL